MYNNLEPKAPILLFDGECNLCNHSVQWILLNEQIPAIHFCSMQSASGTKLLNDYGFKAMPETLVLIENETVFIQSDAVLKIAKKLNWKFKWLSWFVFIPKSWRDGVYNFVARNRIRWFGKNESCFLMKPEWKGRFIG